MDKVKVSTDTAPEPPPTCWCPTRILMSGEDTQPCGKPAVAKVTVVMLGVKVFYEKPFCATCLNLFGTTGIQVKADPIGQVMIVDPTQIGKMQA